MRPPIEIWASPYRDLSAGRWEEKTHKVRSNVEPNSVGIMMQKKKQFNRLQSFFLYYFFLEITCFWPEKNLEFEIWARKSVWISAKIFFLNFFGNYWIFTAPQSNSRPIKIWVKLNKIRSNFQKSLSLCEILATRLILTKVLSMLQKRPPMQNFTI